MGTTTTTTTTTTYLKLAPGHRHVLKVFHCRRDAVPQVQSTDFRHDGAVCKRLCGQLHGRRLLADAHLVFQRQRLGRERENKALHHTGYGCMLAGSDTPGSAGRESPNETPPAPLPCRTLCTACRCRTGRPNASHSSARTWLAAASPAHNHTSRATCREHPGTQHPNIATRTFANVSGWIRTDARMAIRRASSSLRRARSRSCFCCAAERRAASSMAWRRTRWRPSFALRASSRRLHALSVSSNTVWEYLDTNSDTALFIASSNVAGRSGSSMIVLRGKGVP